MVPQPQRTGRGAEADRSEMRAADAAVDRLAVLVDGIAEIQKRKSA